MRDDQKGALPRSDAVDGGTQLTIRQDRSDLSDEQVAATISGYNAFIDDMVDVVARMSR